jgi:iron complex outermembrane receptor protein
MKQKKKAVRARSAARVALLTGAALAGGVASGPLRAQTTGPVATELPRVEVTGSSVRRIDGEAALPVQVLRREDIARSGATSTTELLQRLPMMQGGAPEAAAAGPARYGYTSASIHNLGEARTLVLLNGRRLAQFAGQTLTGAFTATDLNAIPISAIERVEILSDGASSVYGADAVAGVVNFITRRDRNQGDASLGFSAPRGGGQEKRLSASQGWGDLERDGRNLMLAMSAESREALYAAARPYSRSGVADFSHNGQRYQVIQATGSSIPANALSDQGEFISPVFLRTGRCPERHLPVRDAATGSTACYYDFVGDLAMLPARERQSVMGSFTQQAGRDHTLSADVLLARSKSKFQLAPVSGRLAVPAGSPLHDQYLLPLGVTQDSTAFYRAADLGPRSGTDTADFAHLALSAKGLWSGWDYQAGWGVSRSQVKSRIRGYPGALAFNRLLESGVLNPFVGPGQQSPQGAQAMKDVAYDGYWDGGESTLQTWELRGSRPVAQWTHGPVLLGLGVAHMRERFASKPSLFAQGLLADPVAGTLADPDHGVPGDVRFGDESATRPYSARRHVTSGFTELVMPLAKTLELTGSGRIDRYSDFGQARTAKAGLRWQPTPALLFRGSAGTGYRAPSVPQVNAAVQQYGSTSGGYDCTPELAQVAQNLGARCRPDGSQYDVLAGGNGELRPERSRQLSLGLRFEPSRAWTLGADFWHVGLRDVISQVTEEHVFANPLQNQAAFGTVREVSTGGNFLAFQALNQNLGKEYRSGIDFDVQTRWRGAMGQWSSQLLATYLLRQQQQLTPGGPYYSSIGNNAELGQVSFRWQGRWATSLQHQKWRHTVAVNFKSGYRDAAVEAERYGADGQLSGEFEDVRIKVPWTYTVDWQSAWQFSRDLQFVFGVLNVFDRAPPLVVSNGGLDRGQNFGYDDRYYDPRGRVFYGNLNYRF